MEFYEINTGMVGGHCISIDPYYLMHKSEMSGYRPNLMRTARKINDEMHDWVLKNFIRNMERLSINLESAKITVLGYSFKENCSDTRNTKVKNLILSMKDLNINFQLWDPLISEEDHKELNKLGIKTIKKAPKNNEVAFLCVYHKQFKDYLRDFREFYMIIKTSLELIKYLL